MNATHCPPARLAALTNLTDLLTRIEWAHDPDDALTTCGEFPGLIRALVEVLGDEGAKVGPVPDSLEPAPVLSNCRTCGWDSGRLCGNLDQSAWSKWAETFCGKGGQPIDGATGCPGWKAREPEETAEDVARRCGLVRDRHATHCWSVAETGASRVWRRGPDDWHVFEYPITFYNELDALRAYAASVGK